jgi:hypothetical protein
VFREAQWKGETDALLAAGAVPVTQRRLLMLAADGSGGDDDADCAPAGLDAL